MKTIKITLDDNSQEAHIEFGGDRDLEYDDVYNTVITLIAILMKSDNLNQEDINELIDDIGEDSQAMLEFIDQIQNPDYLV